MTAINLPPDRSQAARVAPSRSASRTGAVLYRFFNQGGQLLYAGITANPGTRLEGHRSRAPWWSEVARATFEHGLDRLASDRRQLAVELAHAGFARVLPHDGGQGLGTQLELRLGQAEVLADRRHQMTARDLELFRLGVARQLDDLEAIGLIRQGAGHAFARER